MSSTLEDFYDVLRLRKGKGSPAKVEKMVIELHDKSSPVKAAPRRYTPAKRYCLGRTINKLLGLGFLRRSKNAGWTAAALIVPKAPPENFGLTIDLRPINAEIKPVSWSMPNIDSELGDLRDSKSFVSTEFVSGYWQLPLAEES